MDYLLTGLGITMFYLAGNRVWWAWYLGLVTQALWFAYAIMTAQYGFLIGAFFYSAIYIRNTIKWTKERHTLD